MEFIFDPLSDEDLEKNRKQFAIGKCRFDVVNNIAKISKQGNPMLVLDLILTDCNEMTIPRKHFILNKHQWRLKEFLKAIGKSELYNGGKISEGQLANSFGECITIHSSYEEDGKKKQGIEVESFIATESSGKPIIDEELNDDVPF